MVLNLWMSEIRVYLQLEIGVLWKGIWFYKFYAGKGLLCGIKYKQKEIGRLSIYHQTIRSGGT
jgi:hypothetical protein